MFLVNTNFEHCLTAYQFSKLDSDNVDCFKCFKSPGINTACNWCHNHAG